jgi:methionyl-tRNA synthetase
VYKKAEHQGISPKEYVDALSQKFRDIIPLLGIRQDIHFVRTTDVHHILSAQEFWKRVEKKGYIYKKQYSTKYCVGCELDKTDSELVNGKCPIHPLQDIELISEENYFFKFSAFGDQLLALYERKNEAGLPFVLPESRLNEIHSFVSRGLQDFSISRLKEKMPWGIPVPGDETQVMYVWFDALVNYISTIGWPDDMVHGVSVKGSYQKWHIESGGMVQYCGKDNLRQQSAMWQAMLMAAGLTPSQLIIIDGFITGDGGVKMSKSLGNVVDPLEVVKSFGVDALRYHVCREFHPFEDSPFSMVKFQESYNANLANGIGNLVSRVMKMASTHLSDETMKFPEKMIDEEDAKGDNAQNGTVNITSAMIAESQIPLEYITAMDSYDIQKACNIIWKQIAEADGIIQQTAPFKLVKTDKVAAQNIIKDLCVRLYDIGIMLQPIMPETAKSIISLVLNNKSPEAPLFVRK